MRMSQKAEAMNKFSVARADRENTQPDTNA